MSLVSEIILATALSTGIPAADIECMAQNVYHEARGEGIAGQWLVGSVVTNRVSSKHFPSSPCNVIHEWRRKGLYGCQFSWYCDGKPDRTPNTNAMLWAIGISLLATVLPADDVIGYHESSLEPGWHNLNVLGPTGNHTFYVP